MIAVLEPSPESRIFFEPMFWIGLGLFLLVVVGIALAQARSRRKTREIIDFSRDAARRGALFPPAPSAENRRRSA